MGRHIFRRKTLAALAALALGWPALAPLPAGSSPDPATDIDALTASTLTTSTLEPPPPAAATRYAQRGRPSEAAPAARQSHAGPELNAGPFALPAAAEGYYQAILASPDYQAWIMACLERAEPYAAFIRAAIERNGLPHELFYLPVIESTYRVNARSPSGALGLWQFMHNSIGSWMKVTEWLDERKDFWKSTEAAMKKLRQNYDHTGDWLLAVAAYNCGLTWVLKTMRSSGSADYWELREKKLLPRETRDYVPRFLAVARWASHLGRRGKELPWREAALWERIPIRDTVDLRLLALAAGVAYDELRQANAELVYPITPPGGSGYQLKVPARQAEKVRAALARPDVKLVKFTIHRVSRGDTLYALSLHFGIPIAMIERHNPGLRAETLQIGARVVIPLLRDVGPFVQRPAAASVEEPFVAYDNIYTVTRGDSLWSISRAFGTTTARLAMVNGMNEDAIIQPGMSLKVP